MEDNLLKNTQHAEILTEIQKSVFEHGQFVDCTLLCNGSEFRVHKSILAGASNFFHQLIVDHPINDNLTIILAPEFDADTIFKLMEFIYIGQTHLSSHAVATFQEACEIMQIKNMTPTTSDADVMTQNGQPVIVVEIPNPEDHQRPMIGMEGIITETRGDDDEHIEEAHHQPDSQHGVEAGLHYYEEHHHDQSDTGTQQQHSIIMMDENQEMDLQYIELAPNSESLIQEDEEDIEEETVGDQDEEPAPKILRLNPFTVQQTKSKPAAPYHDPLAKALKALVQRKMNLTEAVEHFGVSKPSLFNRYKKFLIDNPSYRPVNKVKSQGEQAPPKEVRVKNRFAKLNLPPSGIAKTQQRTTKQQNIMPIKKDRPTPSNVRDIKAMSSLEKLHLRANEYKGRLQRAINSCKIGMGLEEASALFSISAPILYRNIKHMKLAHIQQP